MSAGQFDRAGSPRSDGCPFRSGPGGGEAAEFGPGLDDVAAEGEAVDDDRAEAGISEGTSASPPVSARRSASRSTSSRGAPLGRSLRALESAVPYRVRPLDGVPDVDQSDLGRGVADPKPYLRLIFSTRATRAR